MISSLLTHQAVPGALGGLSADEKGHKALHFAKDEVHEPLANCSRAIMGPATRIQCRDRTVRH